MIGSPAGPASQTVSGPVHLVPDFFLHCGGDGIDIAIGGVGDGRPLLDQRLEAGDLVGSAGYSSLAFGHGYRIGDIAEAELVGGIEQVLAGRDDLDAGIQRSLTGGRGAVITPALGEQGAGAVGGAGKAGTRPR